MIAKTMKFAEATAIQKKLIARPLLSATGSPTCRARMPVAAPGPTIDSRNIP